MMARLLLAVLLAFSLSSPSIVIAEVKTDGAESVAVTYRVKKGDTLYGIARKAHIRLAALKRLNHLSNNKIKPGQILFISQAPASAKKSTLAVRNAPVKKLALDENASIFEKAALSFLDTPYRFGGNGQRGIDCSGFVQQVFKEFNFKLPHSAREQYNLGTKVPKDDLQVGDLVFFRTYAKYPSHVGIYLGDNKMIHASTRNRGIVVSNIESRYFRKRYIGAKRIALNHGEINFGEALQNVKEDAAEDSVDGPEEGVEASAGNG